MPGLRDGPPLRRAVRADPQFVQDRACQGVAACAHGQLVAALDAVPPDALPGPHALGAGPAPPPATTRPARRRRGPRAVAAALAAADAGHRAALAAALRPAPGGAA